MMGEEFDFDKVGKRMPYKVPSDFFEKITERTLSEAENQVAEKAKQPVLFWQVLSIAASVAVLLTIGYFMYTGSNHKFKEEKMMTVTESGDVPAADSLLMPEPAIPLATPERPPLAAVPKAAKAPEQRQEQQAFTQISKPETLEEILASISDEELLCLAAIAESDLYVYEQLLE